MSVSIKTAAERLGITEAEVRAAIKSGQIILDEQDLVPDGQIVRHGIALKDAEGTAYIAAKDATNAAERAASYALQNIRDEVQKDFESKIMASVKTKYAAWLTRHQPALAFMADRL